MSAEPSPDTPLPTAATMFVAALRSAATSVFSAVLFGTYIGIGALAHDLGFSLPWTMLSTVLVWAGPAQVILISALASGAAPAEVAIAVGLSGVRLLPMVVALLPVMRTAHTPARHLLLPTHFTAISMWIESMRLLPTVPRERRVAYANGLGTGFMTVALGATVLGFYLAAELPVLFAAALLFLTPMAFLVSTARNARVLVDRLALGFGLVIGPLLAWWDVGLDLLWTGIVGGSLAYGVHRLRQTAREAGA